MIAIYRQSVAVINLSPPNGFGYRVYAVNEAYWDKRLGYLILEAKVSDSDDHGHDVTEWIPDRQRVTTVVHDRFAAIKMAVDDAAAWVTFVKGQVPSFPPEWLPKRLGDPQRAS